MGLFIASRLQKTDKRACIVLINVSILVWFHLTIIIRHLPSTMLRWCMTLALNAAQTVQLILRALWFSVTPQGQLDDAIVMQRRPRSQTFRARSWTTHNRIYGRHRPLPHQHVNKCDRNCRKSSGLVMDGLYQTSLGLQGRYHYYSQLPLSRCRRWLVKRMCKRAMPERRRLDMLRILLRDNCSLMIHLRLLFVMESQHLSASRVNISPADRISHSPAILLQPLTPLNLWVTLPASGPTLSSWFLSVACWFYNSFKTVEPTSLYAC